MDYTQTALVFLAVASISTLIEIIWRKKTGLSYDYLAFGSSIVILVGNGLSKALHAGVIFYVLLTAYQLSPFHWDKNDWRLWVIAFFLMELAYYWQHRWSHTIRWMWATHAVHHSPNEFVLPAAFRLGWTNLVSGTWLVYVPVSLLGVDPLMIVLLLSINLRFQFFLHTEHIGRLGRLEWLFNSPSNHRVHHSSQKQYIDKNFGGILMIFDHLFGTYAAEKPNVPIQYGLTKPLTSNNPFFIVFHEWINLFSDVRNAPNLWVAYRSAFGRPGEISHPKRSKIKSAIK